MSIHTRFVFSYLCRFYSSCFSQNCFRRHQIPSTVLIHPPQQHHWADVTLRLKFTSCLHFCQFLLWVSIFFLTALSSGQCPQIKLNLKKLVTSCCWLRTYDQFSQPFHNFLSLRRWLILQALLAQQNTLPSLTESELAHRYRILTQTLDSLSYSIKL